MSNKNRVLICFDRSKNIWYCVPPYDLLYEKFYFRESFAANTKEGAQKKFQEIFSEWCAANHPVEWLPIFNLDVDTANCLVDQSLARLAWSCQQSDISQFLEEGLKTLNVDLNLLNVDQREILSYLFREKLVLIEKTYKRLQWYLGN